MTVDSAQVAKIRQQGEFASTNLIEVADITTDWGRDLIATRISDALDRQTVEAFDESFRTHLGASVLGSECDRQLWYGFRWFKGQVHDARQLRLFNVGHRLEPLVRAELIAAGCQFLDNVDVDGKQISVAAIMGHAGGSCDGVFIAPQFGLDQPALLEVKTSGTGAKFNKYATERCSGAQPRHFIQQSVLGRLLNIRYALYLVENKNDSSRYLELVELDWSIADANLSRAFTIINSQTPPIRLSNKPEYYICKQCDFNGICHKDEQPVPNCRNCVHASPVENEQWRCDHWNAIIPKDYLINGCPHHAPLTK